MEAILALSRQSLRTRLAARRSGTVSARRVVYASWPLVAVDRGTGSGRMFRFTRNRFDGS